MDAALADNTIGFPLRDALRSSHSVPASVLVVAQSLSRSTHRIQILLDGFQQIAELIGHIAKGFADHAAADEDGDVVVAVGAGGARHVGHEHEAVVDAAEFGEFFFQQ
jgi:hypothetical protein